MSNIGLKRGNIQNSRKSDEEKQREFNLVPNQDQAKNKGYK